MTSLPVRYLFNILCRRRSRATLAVACLLMVVFLAASTLKAWSDLDTDLDRDLVDWEAQFEKARRESLRDNMNFYVADGANLRPVSTEWTARDRCPACFGTDICDAVERQELLVEIPDKLSAANLKGVYFGRWKDMPVVVKLMIDSYSPQFRSFDEFICLKATDKRSCNVSAAILSDIIQEDKDLLSPDRLLSAWKISYHSTGPLALTYALCLTDDIITSFSHLYSVDGGSRPLTRSQRAMLFTSMVVRPESLMLKFIMSAKSDRLAPRVYGACGRLVVVEHGGRLLHNYIDASFSERADLALQLISLMKRLWHADENWFALYSDVQYKNMAVSHYNQIHLIDHDRLSIIPSVTSPRQQPQQHRRLDRAHRDVPGDGWHNSEEDNRHQDVHLLDEPSICNSDCFNGLLMNLSRHDLRRDVRASHCRTLHDVSLSFMYAALCRNIFVDSPSQRGLLHGVPGDDDTPGRSEKISGALRECIHESRPGGRLNAVELLSLELSRYSGMRLE